MTIRELIDVLNNYDDTGVVFIPDLNGETNGVTEINVAIPDKDGDVVLA
jgi:hypothetical protein